MYVWNRPPLAPSAFARLPLGSVRALGWLHEQLRLAAEGFTGHLMDIWEDVGPNSGWLGGSGENWERGPYYVRGLLALAYTLDDSRLIARARQWIEWTLGSQRTDGYFGPAHNDDWWPRMPMLDALRLHHEATGDLRVPPFMTRYFRHQQAHLPSRPLEAWGRPRGGDNLDSVLWLYNRTGDRQLLELADLLHAQTSDWLTECEREAPSADAFDFGHGVNRAMGLKEPLVFFQRSGDPRHREAFRIGWERTLGAHGQVQGTFSGDEFLHGRGFTQGTEFCTIVELLATLERALQIDGEAWIGDAIERIAYNALPAIMSADHRTHQYFQLVNQVECTPGGRNFNVHHETDLLFGPFSGYGCCAANLHMGWPWLVSSAWMATPDGGLLAGVLAPTAVTATVGNGRQVHIVEETRYPFEPDVRFTVRLAKAVEFPLWVRVPGWAAGVTLAVNDVAADPGRVAATTQPRTGAGWLLRLARRWTDGDRVDLHLPMRPRVARWDDALVVERGPLVFALGIGEDWRAVGGTAPFEEYEVHPTTPWNYGLRLDPADPAPPIAVESGPAAAQPWTTATAPVRLRVPGQRLPEWTTAGGVGGPLPPAGTLAGSPCEDLTLVPFGCARLRIAAFPMVR